jgi:hypothetical protein
MLEKEFNYTNLLRVGGFVLGVGLCVLGVVKAPLLLSGGLGSCIGGFTGGAISGKMSSISSATGLGGSAGFLFIGNSYGAAAGALIGFTSSSLTSLINSNKKEDSSLVCDMV